MCKKVAQVIGAASIHAKEIKGVGTYANVREGCEAVIQVDTEQRPVPVHSAEYEKYYKLYQKIYPSLKEQFQELAEIECEKM